MFTGRRSQSLWSTAALSVSLLLFISYVVVLHSAVQHHSAGVDIKINVNSSIIVQSGITDSNSKRFDNVIKMGGRGGEVPWNIVNWDIRPDEANNASLNFDCTMKPFESFATRKNAEICVHTQDDIISQFIGKDKRWRDCNILPALWNESQTLSEVTNDQHTLSVYLEIGANIGSCMLEMLLSTNALIIAVEPHPMNLYNLKKTVLTLGKEYQDRVIVIPVGLGKENHTETIYAVKGNMGNSGIGMKIKDWGSQKWDDSLFYTVNIERLDSILWSEKIHIKMAKMDAQGFECNVLEGMGAKLASTIDVMKFEYQEKFLHPHGCRDLVGRVQDFGFSVYQHFEAGAREPFQKYLASNTLPQFKFAEGELFAVRDRKGEREN